MDTGKPDHCLKNSHKKVTASSQPRRAFKRPSRPCQRTADGAGQAHPRRRFLRLPRFLIGVIAAVRGAA